MKDWLTSDTHYGHANIIKYCNRPFKDVEEMNEAQIKNHNARVKPDDVVYFLGDFCFRNSLGGKAGEGAVDKYLTYLNRLNGRYVFIRGNHDKNNGLKTKTEKIFVNYGGTRIALVHNPMHGDYTCKFNFCGHVHDKWKFKKFEKDGKETLVANVGVDQWGFKPVSFEEVLKELKKWVHNGETLTQPELKDVKSSVKI